MTKMITLSMGTKKKQYNSIMEAAIKVAAETGEPMMRVYMRCYMRNRKLGWKGVTAVNKPARAYKRNKNFTSYANSVGC